MGNTKSKSDGESKKAKGQITENNRKVLLLGRTQVGKTTLCKHIHHYIQNSNYAARNSNLTVEHYGVLPGVIFRQIIDVLCEIASHIEKSDFDQLSTRSSNFYRETLLKLKEDITSLDANDEKILTKDLWISIYPSIARFLNDPSVQMIIKKVEKRKKRLNFNDGIIDLLKHLQLDNPFDDSGHNIPFQNILSFYIKTTGINEFSVYLPSSAKGTDGDDQKDYNAFTFVDVGGQNSERKKWIHAYSQATDIIFMASLSDYNLKSGTQNCLIDSINLFDEISNNIYFRDVNFYLLLNKNDLFMRKLKQNVDIPSSFSQCSDKNSPFSEQYEDIIKYIKKRFSEKFQLNERNQIAQHMDPPTLNIYETNLLDETLPVGEWIMKMLLNEKQPLSDELFQKNITNIGEIKYFFLRLRSELKNKKLADMTITFSIVERYFT